jgi:hypothetical protein
LLTKVLPTADFKHLVQHILWWQPDTFISLRGLNNIHHTTHSNTSSIRTMVQIRQRSLHVSVEFNLI